MVRIGLGTRQISISRVCLAYKEPPHMVDTEAEVSPSQVKFPYMEDEVKMTMYKRHKKSPEEWPISRLAQHFGASVDRVKAILFLMRNREEMMEREKVADIPPEWHQIWARHNEGLQAATAAEGKTRIKSKSSKTAGGAAETASVAKDSEPVAAAGSSADAAEAIPAAAVDVADVAPHSKDAIAKEFALTVEQVGEILDRMKVHMHRKENLEASEAHFQQIRANLKNAGVDTSFRETANAPKRGSVQEDYYPALFGDDGFETARKELLDRITSETKAEIVDFEESLFGRKGAESGIEEVAPPLKPMEILPNKSGVKTDTLSRWKFAFRDLSWRRTQPTMVRTRRGDWRQANALEDAMRSWRKHPSRLDLETYRDEVRQYLDPDGDEADAAQIHVTKLAKRKAKLAAAAAAAPKT